MNYNIDEILHYFKGRIIAKKEIPKREGVYESIPNFCEPELKKCLNKMGFNKLYSHQADMFTKVNEGNNVIITTSTASGKSLAFYLPVFQRIIKEPSSRALFIYPTKALAQDQMKSLKNFVEFFKKRKIKIGIYDGDTPASERREIRKEANIILTNPDMINVSFLPNHNRYNFPYIFSNLDYVVLDELHSYRGVFGSHVSNVMKRLLRVCNYHHKTPVFLCSSATIANPKELAENICHKKFVHISEDGSPSMEKSIIFWQPPYIGKEEIYTRPVKGEMVKLLIKFIENNIRFISFCMSRKETEIVTKECRDALSEAKNGLNDANKISGYRGGYKPDERHRIERELRNGQLLGVVSTNALELGIDIGGLEVAIMGGFPLTRASFWQQLGRAGRNSKKSYAILILKRKPIDQYVGINPNWLIGKSPENAIVDKDNLIIQMAHIRAAVYEIPINIDDIVYFPDLGEILPVLQEINEIKETNTIYQWIGNSSPAHEISLRNITTDTVDVVDENNKKTVTTMDIEQAKKEVYSGAIYIHDTIQYKCTNLNLKTKIASVEISNVGYYTEPSVSINIKVQDVYSKNTMDRVKIFSGYVDIKTEINMFKKIQFYSHANIGFENLSNPLKYQYSTEACWIIVPENVINVLQKSKVPMDINLNFLSGLIYSIKSSAEIKVMASPADIGAERFSYEDTDEVEDADNEEENFVAIILFDKYPGGLGFSEKIYIHLEEIIKSATVLVKNCSCKNGCPACVGDYRIDKKLIIWALENLFQNSQYNGQIALLPKAKISKIKFKYNFETIEKKWGDLVKTMIEKGVYGANFLDKAEDVSIVGDKLILYFPQSVVKLVDRNEIKLLIINNLAQFVDLPSLFEISFKNTKNSENPLKRKKLVNHIINNKWDKKYFIASTFLVIQS